MLNVRPWLQRQRRILLPSILLIWQSHLGLMWIISQPSWLHSLSVSLWPRLSHRSLLGKGELSVCGGNEALCVPGAGQWVVLSTLGTRPCGWEADYPEPLVSAVRQHGSREVWVQQIRWPAGCPGSSVLLQCYGGLPHCITDWLRMCTHSHSLALPHHLAHSYTHTLILISHTLVLLVSAAVGTWAFPGAQLFKVVVWIFCSRHWTVCMRLLNIAKLQNKKYWPSSGRRRMQLLDAESR